MNDVDSLLRFVMVIAAIVLGWHLHELWIRYQGKVAVLEAAYYVSNED